MSERQKVHDAAKEWKAPKSARSATVERKIDSPLLADSASALGRTLADHPRALPGSDLLLLQRSMGNRAVYRLLAESAIGCAPSSTIRTPVQPKLMVGPAGDQFEQEADRVAQQVMNAAEPIGTETARRAAQDQESPQIGGSATLSARRKEMSGDGEFEADGNFEFHLSTRRGGGHTLPTELRAYMEPRFGADFSNVRIHNDIQSDQLNRAIHAQAFTAGQDVFFRRGAYDPGSRSGQELIAHELTHVIQQNGDRVRRRTDRGGFLYCHSPVTLIQSRPAGAENDVIQRKAGFEIQTNFPMKKKSGEDLGYRDKTFQDKNVEASSKLFSEAPYFHIEADLRSLEWEKAHGINTTDKEDYGSSIMEFVTGAYDTNEEGELLLNKTMQRINMFMNIVKEMTRSSKTVELENVANIYKQKLGDKDTDNVCVLERDIVLGEDDPNFNPHQRSPFNALTMAQPQTTFSAGLGNLHQVLGSLLKSELSRGRDAEINTRVKFLSAVNNLVENNFSTVFLGRHAMLKVKYDILDEKQKAQIKGFLFLVTLFAEEPKQLTGVLPPYAKAYYTFMHRVDFNSLYESMTREQQDIVKPFLTSIARFYNDNRIFPRGVGTESKKGPKIADWITSIYQPGPKQDLKWWERSRIAKLAKDMYEQMSEAEKNTTLEGYFYTTRLGRVLMSLGEKDKEAVGKIFSKNQDYKEFLNEIKSYSQLKTEYEKAFGFVGDFFEKNLRAGCAQLLAGGGMPSAADGDSRALLDYARFSLRKSADEYVLEKLEPKAELRYLKKDLLSRGEVTEGAESESMGRWGAEKVAKEGVILEWRSMAGIQDLNNWETSVSSAFKTLIAASKKA